MGTEVEAEEVEWDRDKWRFCPFIGPSSIDMEVIQYQYYLLPEAAISWASVIATYYRHVWK